MPIDIGPIHIGDDPQPQGPPPFTVGALTDELGDGWGLYQLTTTQNGKPVTSKAVPPTQALQPGDAIELVAPDGSHKLVHVNADATDIGDPVEVKAATKATKGTSAPELHNFGTPTHPNWQQGVKDTATGNWSPVGGANGGASAGLDAKTIAQAAAGQDAIAAGKDPSEGELTAMHLVQMQGASPKVGLTTQSATGAALAAGADPQDLANARQHLGEQAYIGLCEQFVDDVSGTTDRTGLGSATQAAQTFAQQGKLKDAGDLSGMQPGDRVYFSDPNQPNGHVGIYSGNGKFISATDGGIQEQDLGDWQKQTGQSLLGYVSESGLPAASAPNGLSPIAMPGAKAAAAKSLQHVTQGGKTYTFDPTTGKYTDSGLPATNVKPDTIERNGKTYQYDPKTDAWIPSPGVPDDTTGNKALQALEQQEQSLTYIQQQIAAGTMNLSDANGYLGAIKQQTAAALAGTTPFDIYKQDQTQRYQQAQVGQSILNNQMTASNTLTNDLLGQYDTGKMGLAGGNYNPIGLAQSLTDERGGNLGPQPTSDTAKALIDAFSPNNQPTIGSATAQALGGPAQPPPGPVSGTENGANQLPPPGPVTGTGPQDNTLAQAA